MSSRVAVVTGGSGGIGSACAVRLARDGYAVIVNFGSDRASAGAVVAEIGGNAFERRPLRAIPRNDQPQSMW